MDIQGLECIKGSSQKNNLELANLSIQQENVTDTAFDGEIGNCDISESELTSSPLSQHYLEEEARAENTSDESQEVDYTSEKQQHKETPTSKESVLECHVDATFNIGLESEDIERESTINCDNWKEDIDENAGIFTIDEYEMGLKDDEAPEHCDGNVKDRTAASNADKSRKRRLAAPQEMNGRKLRRREQKNCSSPQTPPRIGTRRNPRVEPYSSPEHISYVCPLKKWPRTNRMERPEYSRCMETEEEEEPIESECWSEESSESEADFDGGSPLYEAFEACIVPGTLESVVVYCRTSLLLPAPMRPDPEALRDLLHGTCVLQCILRGVAPATIAAYLDSESTRSAATDFTELRDFPGE